MYCTNCGSQIDDKAVVCPHCGVATNNYTAAPTTKQTNVLAIVGFVLSFFVAIAGLICSIMGYKRAPDYNGEGKNLALAGIIISAVEIAASVIIIIFYIIVLVGLLTTLGSGAMV